MKIPVYLTEEEVGELITALAMRIPLVANISTQVTLYKRAQHAAQERLVQERNKPEHQGDDARGTPTETGNSGSHEVGREGPFPPRPVP